MINKTKKPIIAFDLDDVIVDSTGFWLEEVNQRTGSALTRDHFKVPGEYWKYYERTWQEHGVKKDFSIEELESIMVNDQSRIWVFEDAVNNLKQLAKKYDLVVVTARDEKIRNATEKWIQQHFGDLFKSVHFANGHAGIKVKNKGDFCVEIGADWLVDDNPGHCSDALQKGVGAVLFGDYGWQFDAPLDMTKCKDWHQLLEFFREQSK